MKTLNTHEMVHEAVSEIERFAPKNSQVEVDVKEDPVGNFSTQIKIKTKTRVYFAKKEDLFLYKSFKKAMRAIKSQIQKKRVNHDSVRSSKFPAA